MELTDKEVFYYEYCSKCKYWPLNEDDEPCDECLNQPYNEHSHKPIMFKPKE